MASMLTYDGYSSEVARERVLTRDFDARVVRLAWAHWVAGCTDVVVWGSGGNGRRGADRTGRFGGYPVYHPLGSVVMALPHTIA